MPSVPRAPGVPGAPGVPERHPTRRALVTGSLALAVTACEPLGYREPEREDPDLEIVRRAVERELNCLARYDAVRTRYPSLTRRLDAYAAEHRAHLRALRSRTSPSLTASPSPGGPGTDSSDSHEALRALARSESDLARHCLNDLDAASPFLAQLLASIAASESTHAAALRKEDG